MWCDLGLASVWDVAGSHLWLRVLLILVWVVGGGLVDLALLLLLLLLERAVDD